MKEFQMKKHMLFNLLVLTAFIFAVLSVPAAVLASPNPQSCWGQASQVFARMGVMGEHSSSQETPRIGLRNLARSLYEQGILEDDTLQALGSFVADALGLSIEACQ
jgi:hypothetical protein